jgi:REP element-mobilizing transposase RayT
VNSQGGDAPNFILSGDADRKVYLDLLRHSIELHNLTLVRYFLMFNHVHLITIPPSRMPLTKQTR